LHSLSQNEARVVNESGARWIRIDASEDFSDFGASVQNAKAYNLSVLAIPDSWMFNKLTVFSLDDWRGNVTYYVSQYAVYVDAWEIWNEPANPTDPLQNLSPTSPENMTKIVNFYFSMVQTACPIIRLHDPSAKILLFGGLNLYSGSEIHLDLDENFSSQLVAMGIEQFGDAISFTLTLGDRFSLRFGAATLHRWNITRDFSQTSLLRFGLLKRDSQWK
jgi:hypothetical protein